MSLETQAARAAVEVANHVLDSIVDAVEREQARKRIEACEDEIFHAQMVKTLPKWRRIAKAIHRSKARKASARCDALRAKGDPEACLMCTEAKRRGLT